VAGSSTNQASKKIRPQCPPTARDFAKETCFLVVLLLGYQIFGAFGPWKDIRRSPIVQFMGSSREP
jgi:hypothetical protein